MRTRPRSLSARMLLVSLPGALAIAAVASVTILAERRAALVGDLERAVEDSGRTGAEALAEPLWMFRTEVSEGILAGLLGDPRMRCVRQTDHVTGRRMERPEPGCFAEGGPDDRVARFEVRRDGKTIGRLEIAYALGGVDARIAREAGIVGGVLLLAVGALLALTTGLVSWMVERPLRRLSAAVGPAETGDEASTAEPSGEDAIGRLGVLYARLVRESARRSRTLETARREADAARAEAERALADLRAAQRSLIEAERMASVGVLVSGVAHAINTPLGNAITATSHLADTLRAMRERAKSGNVRRVDFEAFMAEAEEAVSHVLSDLDRAGDRVASFKRIAADRSGDVRRTFDAREYLEELLTALVPQASGPRITASVEGAAGIMLDSYPGALAQVITGLVENAMVHGFDGVGGGRVDVVLERPVPGWVRIVVRDDGRGIPAPHVPRLFDPFFTGRPERGDAGLGLHIAHNLVTNPLGGRIAVRSAEGQGTAVILDLPLCAPSPEPRSAVPASP